MNILVTGAAGFIGYSMIKVLARGGHRVVGIDSINDYYDVALKYGRLADHGIARDRIGYNRPVESDRVPGYTFAQLKLEDREALFRLFDEHRFDLVCHLAAQAGVRYSLTNPHAYVDANLQGFLNVLEACRQFPVKHLVYASSSSVYGLNRRVPFSTADNVDHPVSLYAATKKANELMAHTYSHLYGIPTTGLRFFTVYGPWGRPDMAYFSFTRAILEGKPIDVYNNGDMERDFTYIDDIVEGVRRVLDHPPAGNPAWDATNPDPAGSVAPYRIYNIGNSSPVNLLVFIETIERKVGKKAIKQLLPMQPGDVQRTWADVADLEADLGYHPATPLERGIGEFVDWYLSFYGTGGL